MAKNINKNNLSGNRLRLNTRLINRYVIDRVESENSLQIKYLCYDEYENSRVYIYEFFPSILAVRDTGTNLVRFKTSSKAEIFADGLNAYVKEVEKLKEIDNDAVENVMDCFIENNTCYTVCEYTKNETLKEYLKRSDPLTRKKALSIFNSLSDGLTELHDNGIINGNISPEHIIITDEGQAKFADLGVGGYVNSTGLKIYNSRYSADEMFSERGKLNKSSDVYSMGVLLYRLFSGVTPVSHDERKQGKKNIPLRKLGVRIEKGMDNAILNAMCLDRKKRYKDMDEFIDALNSKNTPLIKESSGGGSSGGKGKYYILIAAAAAFAALVIAAVVTIAVFVKDEPKETETVSAETSTLEDEAAAVVYINGTAYNFGDTQPFTDDDGTVYIPVGIYNKLGFTVDYDDVTLLITISSSDSVISTKLGSTVLNVNGTKYPDYSPSQNIDGHNYFSKDMFIDSLARNDIMVNEDGSNIRIIYNKSEETTAEKTTETTTEKAETTTKARERTETTTKARESTNRSSNRNSGSNSGSSSGSSSGNSSDNSSDSSSNNSSHSGFSANPEDTETSASAVSTD